MLIEEAAQRNRWRGVCPQAKALFAAAGLVAANLAATPAVPLSVAGVCAAFADLPACRAPSQPSKGSAATIAMVGRRARKPCSGNVGGMQTRTVAR